MSEAATESHHNHSTKLLPAFSIQQTERELGHAVIVAFLLLIFYTYYEKFKVHSHCIFTIRILYVHSMEIIKLPLWK